MISLIVKSLIPIVLISVLIYKRQKLSTIYWTMTWTYKSIINRILRRRLNVPIWIGKLIILIKPVELGNGIAAVLWLIEEEKEFDEDGSLDEASDVIAAYVHVLRFYPNYVPSPKVCQCAKILFQSGMDSIVNQATAWRCRQIKRGRATFTSESIILSILIINIYGSSTINKDERL